ncbi:hypothetical protein B0H13DRAFT_2356452 [Mycena leptocephala]|nr:hypothetical protein B0H13DRAFT_2356452 [Mycena leptocephala]
MSTDPNEAHRAPGNRSNVESTASTLRSRLGALEQQIASLQSQMELLHTQREEVLQDLARIVYPVLELPAEITSEIFLQCTPDGCVSRQNITPLALASVCRLWRAIALSTFRIWTHQPTRILDSGRRLYPCRSSYTITPSPSPEPNSILRSVARHSSRWGNLDLSSEGSLTFPPDVEGPFSALTRISLRSFPCSGGLTTIPILCGSTLLREVCLDGVELANWHASLPWMQLTKLEIFLHAVAECVAMVAHTPNLEVLIFTTECNDAGFPPNAPLPAPCTLPRLHTLHIGLETSPQLMEYLVTPSLEHLHLDWLDMECSGYMRRLIARSGCSLRTLVLWIYYPDLVPIFDCVSHVPSLRQLQLTWLGATTNDYSSLFKFLAEYPTVLPALESFTIDE